MKFLSIVLGLMQLTFGSKASTNSGERRLPQERLTNTDSFMKKMQSNTPCWDVNDPQIFNITLCGSGTVADGLQLTTSWAGTSLPDIVGFGTPSDSPEIVTNQFFIEPTMGYLCLSPDYGAAMLQLCISPDNDNWCFDPYDGLEQPWVQAIGWFQGNPFPDQLLSCTVDETQLLSCQYSDYKYLESGPELPGGGLWFPLSSNTAGSGSQYFTTNGSCN